MLGIAPDGIAQTRISAGTSELLQLPRVPGERHLFGRLGAFEAAGRQVGAWTVLPRAETGIEGTGQAKPADSDTGAALGSFAETQSIFSRIGGRHEVGAKLRADGTYYPRVAQRTSVSGRARVASRSALDARHFVYFEGLAERRPLEVANLPPAATGSVIRHRGLARSVILRRLPPYSGALGLRVSQSRRTSRLQGVPDADYSSRPTTIVGVDSRAAYSWREGYEAFALTSVSLEPTRQNVPFVATLGAGVATDLPELAQGAGAVFLDRSEVAEQTRYGVGLAGRLDYRLTPLWTISGRVEVRPIARLGPFGKTNYRLQMATRFRPAADLSLTTASDVRLQAVGFLDTWRAGQDVKITYRLSRAWRISAAARADFGRAQATGRRYWAPQGRLSVSLQI